MQDAPDNAVLLLDGIFLHRPELRHWWDLSIWLAVQPPTAAERLQRRDGQPPHPRYLKGQELYIAEAKPKHHASLVVPW
jgi:uridine kinase